MAGEGDDPTPKQADRPHGLAGAEPEKIDVAATDLLESARAVAVAIIDEAKAEAAARHAQTARVERFAESVTAAVEPVHDQVAQSLSTAIDQTNRLPMLLERLQRALEPVVGADVSRDAAVDDGTGRSRAARIGFAVAYWAAVVVVALAMVVGLILLFEARDISSLSSE